MGLSLKRVAKAVSTGGLSEVLGSGGVKDSVFGKKDLGTGSRWLDLDPRLKKNVDKARDLQYAELSGLDAGKDDAMAQSLARMSEAKGIKSVLGGVKDRQMRAEELRAQSGLSGTSIGLGSALGMNDRDADKISSIRSMAPIMEDQLKEERRKRRLGTIGSIMKTPGQQRTYVRGRQGSGKRSGGIGNILMAGGGAALGGMAGGPMGAAAGMQMGSGFGQMV